MMESDFSFRIRFTLPDQERLNVDAETWELVQESDQLGSVSLTTVRGGPIRESSDLVLRGRGYPDADTAREAAETVRDLVTIAFARARVAADFGDRAPKSMFFDAGLQMLETQHGVRVLNDVHGMQVYESDPTPRFARVSAKAQVGRSGARVKACVEQLLVHPPRLERKVRAAYDLYAASFRVGRTEARFLLLMVALETFIDRQPRSDRARELVARFLAQLDDSEVPVSERESLRGSLRWLMDESIGQAGRRVASALADHRYAEMDPDRFFTKCYEVRGKLVHGDMVGDSLEGVTALVAPLETFVGDLISVPFLGARKG